MIVGLNCKNVGGIQGEEPSYFFYKSNLFPFLIQRHLAEGRAHFSYKRAQRGSSRNSKVLDVS